ncbi:CLAVATA3/ESR (CLE)-related protein 27 [Quillaja saponaria]|uniref:CLAVATA3/ESR (CLE)-related protein 27 n=1 Tax=Quillaja saponaria TaxID=32244 RepID=A0AAD7KP55_QUISA|nr:CLAVATA3/ESR (CLE)-related protein 27 [Quillaja saponaria]
MCFAGGRKLMYLSVVVLLIISVLQMWVFCHSSSQVGAIRIFPANAVARVKLNQANVDKKSKKQDLFHKYFSGRSFGPNRPQNGFEESKRRVPSCPDPLHN